MPIEDFVSGGWRPSKFDGRDAIFDLTRAARGGDASVALLPIVRPPWDQGRVPCCVSIAVATCMEILDARTAGVTLLAPLFNYFLARSDRTALADIEIRDGIKSAVSFGISALPLHPAPMTPAGAAVPPSREAVADASLRRLVGFDPRRNRFAYWAVPDPSSPEAWRAAISSGFPIVFGFWMTAAYLALSGTDVHGPVAGLSSIGKGHACVVVGYSDSMHGGALLVRDSRGGSFGDRGMWWFPYPLLASGVVREAWVITKNTYDT
jgi:hypothetical protein